MPHLPNKPFLIPGLLICLCSGAMAQDQIGINTSNPIRTLELYGSTDQLLRVHSTSISGVAGVELIRGWSNQNSPDWRIVNDGGHFRIQKSTDNFVTNAVDALRINLLNQTGIGTNSPTSLLHIDGGSDIAFGGQGYLRLGHPNTLNVKLDYQQLQYFNGGLPSTLNLQPHGGNTYISTNGGNTYMAIGGGKVAAGSYNLDAALTSTDHNFQFQLRNDANGINGWNIGASNSTWGAGGNQLLFSPTTSSNDAVLRLMNVTENDGAEAPVMIYTTYDHTLLLDGNEIDTRGTPLYLNHNSDHNTYINRNTGSVGIGTTNPQAKLHIDVTNDEPLALENANGGLYFLQPAEGGSEDLYFITNDLPLAHIDGQTGQWFHLSDARTKSDIQSLHEIAPSLQTIPVYRYKMKQDPDGPVAVGVMAQDAALHFDQVVYSQEGQLGVSYGQLAAVGVKAVQEHQILIDQLTQKIKAIREAQRASVSYSDK